LRRIRLRLKRIRMSEGGDTFPKEEEERKWRFYIGARGG